MARRAAAIIAQHVTSIAASPDGVVWIGTEGADDAALKSMQGRAIYLRLDRDEVRKLIGDLREMAQ